MSRKAIAALVSGLSLAALLTVPVFAQDATEEAPEGDMMMPPPANAITLGLSNPRGVAYDDDGNLYIAEAGSGGDLVFMNTDDGPVMAGFTGQVSMIAPDGTQSVALPSVLSFAFSDGQVLALERAYPAGDSMWLVINGFGRIPSASRYDDAVMEIDTATGRVMNFIDMYANEVENNPDGADPIDSNVNDLAWDADGNLYIVDTGANTIFTWTEADGLEVFHVWKDNSVPTALRFASDGSFYVGFLGAGLAPGAAKVEHWSADGSELLDTFGGLTAVTDIALDAEDNVYAVQLFQMGEQGPAGDSGSVVMVSADGVTTVADGLNFPFGLAQAPDGSWAVSVNSAFLPAGAGAVVKVGGM